MSCIFSWKGGVLHVPISLGKQTNTSPTHHVSCLRTRQEFWVFVFLAIDLNCPPWLPLSGVPMGHILHIKPSLSLQHKRGSEPHGPGNIWNRYMGAEHRREDEIPQVSTQGMEPSFPPRNLIRQTAHFLWTPDLPSSRQAPPLSLVSFPLPRQLRQKDRREAREGREQRPEEGGREAWRVPETVGAGGVKRRRELRLLPQ